MNINSVYIFAITSVFLISCSTTSSIHLPQPSIQTKTAFGLLEISSFDVYADGNTFHLLISGTPPEKNHSTSVRYLQSTDGGLHWSAPVNIGENLPTALASRGNDVQIAAQDNNIIALWQVQGEIPNNGPLVSFYSKDGGKSWQQGKNPAVDDSGDQSHADLLVDEQGYFHTVWLADPEENGYQSLRYSQSTNQGEMWQTPRKLDDSTCSCCSNTLALSPDGMIHVLYRDAKPRDMTMLSSSDNGITWQNKQTIGEFHWQFDGCPHVGGALTFDESNNFYSSVWTGSPNISGLYTVSANKTVKIGKNATHSDIVALEGRIVVVWDEMSPEGTTIYTSQSIDNGNSWSLPRRLSDIGSFATHPRILATDNNNAQIFWTEKQRKQPSKLAIRLLD